MAESPKYVVIFTSELISENAAEYEEVAQRIATLAKAQKGFLSVSSTRIEGKGITISYWASQQDVYSWKWHEDHQLAQKLGRDKFYKQFHITVARIEKETEFTRHGK